ncbi:hypothetical protein GCM10025867_08830 [Frondihabitans sucicola]|uniref:TIR domain-containing protein n=1 Tax=Frondihabitans sucicola TaxID=1268041 RepID=A0ABM8GJS4_9MICO|nr:toll/interleukin-1 receptor domain-containing protein [Frondihabitans sucicola]BDZ48642.1 hypothetical protein GCM10025867_08830 [Frondihabitans sucicola]
MTDNTAAPRVTDLAGVIDANPITPELQAATGSLNQDADEITVFLSYAHADEDAYQMMSPFKELLGHFVYSKSGKKVRAFLDRDSLEWGEYWGERLDAEILAASVFIPLLSASYLDSDNCRLEFNRFQSKATDLGVRELLLPILVLDAPAIFNDQSTDDIVREARARQWEVIEEAVLTDPGSSEWKKTMSRLAARFVRSYQVAESHLATLSQTPPQNEEELIPGANGDDDDDLEAPGLADLFATFEQKTTALTQIAEEMGPAIEDLGNAAEAAGPLKDNPGVKDVQSWTFRSAQAFSAPAEKISSIGEQLFLATKDLDIDMREFRRIAQEAPVELGFIETYNSMIEGLSGMGEVVGNLDSLLDSLKPVEYFSVALRKSLRPARRGVTRVTDSIRLIETWKELEPAGS